MTSLVAQLILMTLVAGRSSANLFTPPFLRPASAKAPEAAFSYIGPQAAQLSQQNELSPSSSGYLKNAGNVPVDDGHQLIDQNIGPMMLDPGDQPPEPIGSNPLVPNVPVMGPNAHFSNNQQFPGSQNPHIPVQENHAMGNQAGGNSNMHIGQPQNMHIPGTQGMVPHEQYGGLPMDSLPQGGMSGMGNYDHNPHTNINSQNNAMNMHSAGQHVGNHQNQQYTQNHQNQQYGQNHQNVPQTGVMRPQLRQLELDARKKNQNRVNRRNRSSGRVSEGHRLITRALWRIFDALMEKNQKEEIADRVLFVENAIKDMISSDSKLEGLIELITDENMVQENRLNELSEKVEEMTRLENRVYALEDWRLTVDRSEDQELVSLWKSEAAHTSCPSSYQTVEGECFYVGEGDKRTWQEARRECSKHGGDLAAPANFESLRTFLNDQKYQHEYLWVGASRQGNGLWMWSAGPGESRAVDMSEDTWNDNLPNGLGNCMGLYLGSQYRAYDYNCEEPDHFVCQYFF